MSKSPIWRWFGKVNEGDQAKAKCKVCESDSKQITLRMGKGTSLIIRYHLQYELTRKTEAIPFELMN